MGVADVDMAELRNIGSKPSDRHVFVVKDYDEFAKIQDNLITFICETATSSMLHFWKLLYFLTFFSVIKKITLVCFFVSFLQHVL